MATAHKNVSTHTPDKRTTRLDPIRKEAELTLLDLFKRAEQAVVRSWQLAGIKQVDSIASNAAFGGLSAPIVHVKGEGKSNLSRFSAAEDLSAQVKSHAKLASSLAGQLAETGVPTKAIELMRKLYVVDTETLLLTLFGTTQGMAQLLPEGRPSTGAADPLELLTASKMAAALGVSDETVRNYEKADELFSFMSPARKRGRAYPAFQAMKGVSGAPLSKVLAALKGLDGASIYQFFSSPSPELAGLTPVEVMTGQLTLPRVLDNAGLEILKAADARRLLSTVGAAKAFHADAAA